MRVHLNRPIEVHCWRVVGQIARARKRAELLPVLLRAREQGATDARDIADHLLFESSSRLVVARRLLEIATRYRLLEERDRRFVLTDAGQDALQTETVFVPEQGAWSVWASQDLLLPSPILRVEPWSEPSAFDEVRGRDREAANERRFERLPSWLVDATGLSATPAAGGGDPVRLEELEREGQPADPDASLTLTWDVEGRRLRLEGSLGGTPVDAALDAPDVSTDQVWNELLQGERLWSRWDTDTRSLQVGFDETEEPERESLVRTVTFRSPEIGDLGRFKETSVQGVALRPRTARDAEEWATWRLQARVRDYATTARYERWAEEAMGPFEEFAPSVPSREQLAEDLWDDWGERPSAAAWYLAAAEDWGL